jgi:hypothetical protein
MDYFQAFGSSLNTISNYDAMSVFTNLANRTYRDMIKREHKWSRRGDPARKFHAEKWSSQHK